MIVMKHIQLVVVLFATLTLVGCGEKENPGVQTDTETVDAENADEHAHPSEGPHHGSLIELGKEEYHAELVHDEAAGTVTIYILDGPTAQKAVPIDAPELTINLKHDGKGEQFKLAASPDTGDPEGKSSRFVSSDKELASDLDREDADAVLVLSINGKSFRGEIAHDHEEGDDEHKHDH